MEQDKTARQLLYEKLDKEYSVFYDNLKTMSAEEVIKHCYEKIFKEDLLLCIKDIDLADEQISKLLNVDNLLDHFYQEWLDNDYSYMEMLRDTVRGSIDLICKNDLCNDTSLDDDEELEM